MGPRGEEWVDAFEEGGAHGREAHEPPERAGDWFIDGTKINDGLCAVKSVSSIWFMRGSGLNG